MKKKPIKEKKNGVFKAISLLLLTDPTTSLKVILIKNIYNYISCISKIKDSNKLEVFTYFHPERKVIIKTKMFTFYAFGMI